jgi:hypothetical protein
VDWVALLLATWKLRTQAKKHVSFSCPVGVLGSARVRDNGTGGKFGNTRKHADKRKQQTERREGKKSTSRDFGSVPKHKTSKVVLRLIHLCHTTFHAASSLSYRINVCWRSRERLPREKRERDTESRLREEQA